MYSDLNDKSKHNLRVPEKNTLKTLIPSFGLLVMYFFTMYNIMFVVTEKFEEYTDTQMGKYNMIYIPYSVSVLLVNIFFIVLYIFDKQYFHKFKINNRPWPWQESEKKWKKMLYSIICIYVIYFICFLSNLLIPSS